jgi:hypothetical protein
MKSGGKPAFLTPSLIGLTRKLTMNGTQARSVAQLSHLTGREGGLAPALHLILTGDLEP